MNITGFTSLLETSYGKIPVASSNLLNGIRIKHGDSWYLVGTACRDLGRNPHRLVNASPEDIDFQVLLNAALLFSCKNASDTICLSLGFPFVVFNQYRDGLEKLLSQKNFVIEYDTSTYIKDGEIKKKIIEVEKFEVIPELAACVIGLKRHYKIPEKNFLMISLGFGTSEMGLVTEDGLNKRTILSIPGIVRCIQNLRDELEKNNNTGFITDHQLDEAFIRGSIILNRKTIDLVHIRKNILTSFYKEYISDTIKSKISDRDFEKIEKIYVCGGGVNYAQLQELFISEFNSFIPIEFVKEPEYLAATGYYHNALRLADSADVTSVGIDLGNSSTNICTNYGL